jgi:hypothetical protein
MTPTQQFIEDAIAGGWSEGYAILHDQKPQYGDVVVQHEATVNSIEWHIEMILLDPLAWQAVAKTRGEIQAIPEGHCELCGEPMPEGETMFRYHGYSIPCPKPPLKGWDWRDKLHRFIDHLADGKTIDEALASL